MTGRNLIFDRELTKRALAKRQELAPSGKIWITNIDRKYLDSRGPETYWPSERLWADVEIGIAIDRFGEVAANLVALYGVRKFRELCQHLSPNIY